MLATKMVGQDLMLDAVRQDLLVALVDQCVHNLRGAEMLEQAASNMEETVKEKVKKVLDRLFDRGRRQGVSGADLAMIARTLIARLEGKLKAAAGESDRAGSV